MLRIKLGEFCTVPGEISTGPGINTKQLGQGEGSPAAAVCSSCPALTVAQMFNTTQEFPS